MEDFNLDDLAALTNLSAENYTGRPDPEKWFKMLVQVLTNTTSTDDPWDRVSEGLIKVQEVLVPLLLICGLPGNLIAIFVFSTKPLRGKPTSCYLGGMAVAHSLFLTILAVNWVGHMGAKLLVLHGFCQLHLYVWFVSKFLSVWFLVGFVLEQYVTVCHPMKSAKICSLQRTRFFILLFVVLSMTLYLYIPVMTRVYDVFGHSRCSPKLGFVTHVNFLNHFSRFMTGPIPYLSIFVLSLRMFSRIYAISRASEERLRRSGDRGDAGRGERPSHLRIKLRITRVLLLVSSIYTLLSLPWQIYRFYAIFFAPLNTRDAVLDAILSHTYYLQFSLNFYIFSALASKFRKSVLVLVCPCREFLRQRLPRRRRRHRASDSHSLSGRHSLRCTLGEAPSTSL